VIEHARHLHTIDVTSSLPRTRIPARVMAINILRGVSKLLVVARGKVDAKRRRKLPERRHQPVEVAFGAVEKVAGKKNYVRLEGLDLGHETAAELPPLMGPRCRSLSSTARRVARMREGREA